MKGELGGGESSTRVNNVASKRHDTAPRAASVRTPRSDTKASNNITPCRVFATRGAKKGCCGKTEHPFCLFLSVKNGFAMRAGKVSNVAFK